MNWIPYPLRRCVYRAVIRRCGPLHQQRKFTEELDEFLDELIFMLDGTGDPARFADELADLAIMCEQLRLIYDVDAAVCRRMDYKVRRLVRRLIGIDGGKL